MYWYLEWLGNLLQHDVGDGLVYLGTLLKVIGHKVPGVGHRPAALLARLQQLARNLEQAPASRQGIRVSLTTIRAEVRLSFATMRAERKMFSFATIMAERIRLCIATMRAERIRLSYHNADRKEKLNFATSWADFLG